MKCYTCGNTYNEYEGTLELFNKSIGNYNIYSAKYFKCTGCAALLYPKETARRIALTEDEIRNNLIRKLPVDEFIVATAADIMGITKQAFHENRRIKKGFVYSTVLGGKRLYNRKSVQLFKETMDGRFNLSNQIANEVVNYVPILTGTHNNNIVYIDKADNREECQEYSWRKIEIRTDNE